jgi:hypothetical protein
MNRGLWALLICLSACGGSGTAHVGLGARAGTAASTAAALNQEVQQLDLQNGIVVTRLRVALSEVKLESGSSGSEGELKTAPLLIDLLQPDLERGTSREVELADIPAGTYRELAFRIHEPKLAEPGVSLDNGLFWMASDGASVIVDGTIDGKPFTFKSAIEADETVEGTFDLGAGNHYVTLNVDPTGWFGGANASRLDPTNDANRPRIEDNIRKSFQAFKDDDHDGREDRD